MSTGPAPTTTATPPTKAHVQRIFTALLVIGVSGAGKTSLLATFADYLWETYQKILLLYSWDGGAIPTDIQKRIHQGLIRFWRVRTRSAEGLGLESMHFATRGYWPRRINPKTGETEPAVELVSPLTTKYEVYSPAGLLLYTVPVASLIKPILDPATNKMLTIPELQVKEIAARTKGFEQVGGVAYDGLTSMAQVVMDHQDQMRGAGVIGGEKSSFGGAVPSGSIKYGGNNRADVGFAQTRAQQFVNNTLSIPGLVEAPVFTGLSTEGTDKGGQSIIGVDLPGQAALTQAPQWFGNICEADTITDSEGKPHFCLNLTKFTDALGRTHLLKTAASPFGIPKQLIDPAQGEGVPFTQFNLGLVFKLLDQDLQKALAEDAAAGMPGIPDGLVEYGEPARVEATGAKTGVPSAAPPAGTGKPGPAAAPPASAPAKATAAPAPTPPAVTPATAPAAASSPKAASAPPAAATPRTQPVSAAPAPVAAQATASTAATPTPAGTVPPPPGRPPARAPGAPPAPAPK